MDETSTKPHDFAQILFLIKSLYECLQAQLNATVEDVMPRSLGLLNKKNLKELVLLYDHTRRFSLNFRNKYPLELIITNQICEYLNQYELLFKLLSSIIDSDIEINKESIIKINSLGDKIQRIKFLLIISIINHEDYSSMMIKEE